MFQHDAISGETVHREEPVGGTKFGSVRGRAAAIVAVLAIGASLLAGAGPASAAPIASSSIDLMLDGTGQGTENGCLVEDVPGVPVDASPTDGVVCSNDTVQYGWNYSVPAAGAADVTFVQTLPAGWKWDDLALTACEGGDDYSGTASLSSDGLTLTCVLTFPSTGSARSGQLPVFAKPAAGVANASTYVAQLSVTQTGLSEPQVSSADVVTVRSQPRWNLSKNFQQVDHVDGNGPVHADFGVGDEPAVRIWFNSEIRPVAGNNFKGQEPLAAPVTFTDVVSGISPEALLGTCNASFGEVPMTCTQPGGPGSDIQITLTNGMQVPPEGGYNPTTGTLAQAAQILVLIPLRTLPAYPEFTQVVNQFIDFEPVGPTGQSNLGPNYETGSEPGATCYVGNDNCAAGNVTRPASGPGAVTVAKGVRKHDATCHNGGYQSCGILEGQTGTVADWGSGNHDGLAYRGDDIIDGFYVLVDPNRELPANLTICDKWDPALQTIDPDGFDSPPSAGTLNGVNWQFTNRVFADDAARQDAGCGTIADPTTDGPWFSTIDEAGGPGAVTAARSVVPIPFGACCIPVSLPLTVAPTAPVGAVVPDFVSFYYDQADATNNPDKWTYSAFDSYRVNDLQVLLDKDTVPKGQTGSVAGGRVNFSLDLTAATPGAEEPRSLTGVSVVDTLDTCLGGAQLDPGTTDWSMSVTPGDFGPDGIACTSDDVSGDVLTFTPTGELSTTTPIQQIAYSVVVSVLVTNGQKLDNIAIAAADGTFQSEASRTDEWELTVAAPGAVRVSKTADQSVVEITPDTISWTINFANTLSSNIGETTFIDLLPYNGDGRGTQLDGLFGFSGAEVLTAGDTTIFYTTDTVASIDVDPQSNSSTWTEASAFAGDLSTVTAIKIVSDDFGPGRNGAVRIHAAPTGNVEGNVYGNDVGAGRAELLAQPIPPTLISQISVVASSIGDRVWLDANSDGVQDAGEAGIENVTVELLDATGSVIDSSVTGADGTYSFDNRHSGVYSTRVVASTLPPELGATYDLQHGTTAPDGNSGAIDLAINSDFVDADFGYNVVPAAIEVEKVIDGEAAAYATGPYSIVVTCSLSGEVLSGFPQTLVFTGAEVRTVPTVQGAVCSATETSTGGATSVTYLPADPVTATPSGEPARITVTNTFDAGSLVINKALDGVGAEDFGGGPFTFDVTCSFDGDENVFSTDVTLERDGAETVLTSDPITGLPIGAECVVTETDTGGADATPAPVTVTISANDDENTVTAGFVNEFSAGTLSLTKTLAGDGADEDYATEMEFRVLVTCQVETTDELGQTVVVDLYSGTVSVSGGETVHLVDDNGDALLLPVGTHCFGDETEWGAATSHTVDYDSYDNALIVVAGTPDELQQLSLTATNTFDTAKLVVSKTVVGPGSAGPYTFEVSCTFDGEPFALAAGDSAFTLSHGESRTIEVVAGADCTAVETHVPTAATVSIVDSDDLQGRSTTDGSVSAISDTATIDFTNTFEPLPIVTPANPGHPIAALPNTGFASGVVTILGSVGVLGGLLVLFVARRRRAS